MAIIKQIDRYILRSFLKTFSITFFGSIFVLLMQFMFHYADDLVGKGVGMAALAEFFFYAMLTLVPMSLPLSILLGSLMTFGNLGERFELLAMKAAGISLFRIMRSLIVLMALFSVASFRFADNILPRTQVKMWTMLFSIREKSPELDIPEGAFYNGIPDRNIYVMEKKGSDLLGVMIYDFSNGFENTSIIMADTGTMVMSDDKKYLLLTLKNGESFENMQNSGEGVRRGSASEPYRRESFGRKEIIIDFDANFNQMSSDFLEGQYVSKNLAELTHSVDSIHEMIGSIRESYRVKVVEDNYFEDRKNTVAALALDTAFDASFYEGAGDYEQAYARLDHANKLRALDNAVSDANSVYNGIKFDEATYDWHVGELRKHEIEAHKKFTLSFACIVFLFIGAPLGAIIRKGGMGMPIVVSTVLFIIYYIIDNTGYKLAREGILPVPAGMWLSAALLLPLGIFLTVMAATDSTIMSGETYVLAIKKLFKRIKNIASHPIDALRGRISFKDEEEAETDTNLTQ